MNINEDEGGKNSGNQKKTFDRSVAVRTWFAGVGLRVRDWIVGADVVFCFFRWKKGGESGRAQCRNGDEIK